MIDITTFTINELITGAVGGGGATALMGLWLKSVIKDKNRILDTNADLQKTIKEKDALIISYLTNTDRNVQKVGGSAILNGKGEDTMRKVGEIHDHLIKKDGQT